MRIPLDQIIPDPNQPRKTFDAEAIKELASSLESYGIISPITVRPCGDDRYMIVTGEMRWRAANLRGEKDIEVGDPIDATDQQAREMQFIENIQKTDVSDYELGEAFLEYCSKYNISQSELARRLGKSQPYVNERIKLVEYAADNIINDFKAGKLQFSEVTQLAKIKNHKRQEEVAQPFISGDVSSKHAAKVCEIARKEPERPVDDIIGEVVYGIGEKEKEILRKPSKPTTIMDTFYRLEKMANKLSDELRELQQFPGFGKAILGIALQSLQKRIAETLERMSIHEEE